MNANPLTSTLAALLERAAGAALALDADAQEKISTLDGQVLLLELSAIPNAQPLAIRIGAHNESLTIMADSAHNTQAPNTIVRGNLTDVLSALWSDELPPGITIEGDERLLVSLRECFRNLTPDWRDKVEDLIARLSSFGPIGGTNNGKAAGSIFQDVLGQAELAFDTLRTTLGDALDNTGDQAREAAGKYWAKENDLDDFATRLENLQIEIDRLNAQIDLMGNNSDS